MVTHVTFWIILWIKIEWVGGGDFVILHTIHDKNQKIEAKEIWEPYILVKN